MPERAKKLITGEGGRTEAEPKGMELLERLIVLWDAESHDEELNILIQEIELWFEGGHRVSNTCSFWKQFIRTYAVGTPGSSAGSHGRDQWPQKRKDGKLEEYQAYEEGDSAARAHTIDGN